MDIKTRRQAAEDGENKYYTGKPCVNGHDSPRYTSTGICCKCNAEGVKKYNKNMRILHNSKLAGWFSYPSHPDDVAALLAYAQALDIARGRMPHVPAEVRSAMPFDVAAARRRALGKAAELTQAGSSEPYMPNP